MFNPFGEDDDDYEMNVFIDQYMKVTLVGHSMADPRGTVGPCPHKPP